MRKTIHGFAILGFLTLPLALSAHRHSGSDTEIQTKKADQQLAEKIQEAVEKDRFLSTHNVSVSVQTGVVTLKGTVLSDEESQEIEGIAEDLAIQTLPLAANAELVSYPVIHNEIAVSSD